MATSLRFPLRSRAARVTLVIRNMTASAGGMRDTGSSPGSGRSPGGGHSSPLQSPCLESPMDRGAWRATVHRVRHEGSNLAQHTQRANTGWDFPGVSVSKESSCNADLGSFPGSRRSSGEGNGNPLQYSCLENTMDMGAWRTAVHSVTESCTRLK